VSWERDGGILVEPANCETGSMLDMATVVQMRSSLQVRERSRKLIYSSMTYHMVSTALLVKVSCSAGGCPGDVTWLIAPYANSSTYASHAIGSATADSIVTPPTEGPFVPESESSPQSEVLNATIAGSLGPPVPVTT
jgi:hypothetical protein